MAAQATNYTPVQANLIAAPLFIAFAAAVLGPYSMIWDGEETSQVVGYLFGEGWVITLVVFLASIVVHELLHGVGFMLAGVPREDVKFGVHWKLLTPYATTKVAMTASQYRFATALPGIVLGVVPSLVGLATGNAAATVYGAALFAAACGDALVLWGVRKVPGTMMVRDCDQNVGCEVVPPLEA